jgi:WD40 repeat protein
MFPPFFYRIVPRLLSGWIICLSLLLPAWGYGSEPTTRPLLRIEGNMHTKAILRIATDSGNNFLASISLDKTIRIWQLPSGRLRKTIRVPIAPGSEGELSAVAVSPGGGIIAASGSTGNTWEKGEGYFIYLFDTATGHMQTRIGGLPAKAGHLAISPNGKYLAVVMEGSYGLRVYKIKNGRLLRSDKHYKNSSTWVDFDKDGRLVTSSLDGFIRLYDERFSLLQKKKISSDYKPHSVVFSPDGEKIAVGFRNRPTVVVFSAEDLSLLYFPDATSGVGDFRTVAWSVDGKSLYGAGDHNNHQRRLIRVWKKSGRPGVDGEYTDLPVSSSVLTQIIPLQDGGVVFAGMAPVLGGLDAQGFFLFRRSKPSANFYSWRRDLLISADGSTVSFPLDGLGRKSGNFSVRDLKLISNKYGKSVLLPPKVKSRNIMVTGWNGYLGQLKFMGQKSLLLNTGERANALSITRDERFFVVGTSSHLRLYDSSGQSKWAMPVSVPVQGVNVSSDDRVIVAAHIDGTIRWYRSGDGSLFLSLFPHRDRKRWIAWTPDKIFTASPGGDKIIGWHRNRGRKQTAKFIFAADLRKTNFKPERIRGLFGR